MIIHEEVSQIAHGLTTTQTIGSLLVDLSKLGAAAFGGWMTAKKSADA